MKHVYRLCCKTACITGIMLASSITGMNVIRAQSDPDYSKASYTPNNVGKVIPNAHASYTDARQKIRLVYEASDNPTPLPQTVAMRELIITPTTNEGIVIRWRTNWEPDNLKLYELEFSTDNFHFQQVGVIAAGNYLNGKQYEFRHYPVNVRDRMFYRIRIVDANGMYDYSPLLSLAATTSTQNYVFPTVVNTGTVSVYLNDPFKTIQVVDMQGRILQVQQLNGKTGRIDMPLNASAQGTCFVRVMGGQAAQKNIVQKIFIR